MCVTSAYSAGPSVPCPTRADRRVLEQLRENSSKTPNKPVEARPNRSQSKSASWSSHACLTELREIRLNTIVDVGATYTIDWFRQLLTIQQQRDWRDTEQRRGPNYTAKVMWNG